MRTERPPLFYLQLPPAHHDEAVHAPTRETSRSRSASGPASTLLVALALLLTTLAVPPLAATPSENASEPWVGSPFTTDPKTLLTAASRAAASDAVEEDTSILVLYQGTEYHFDADGRRTYTRHLIYSPLDTLGVEGWAQVGSDWSPWFQERPTVEARVISPDGTVRQLDPSTLVESPTAEGSPDIYDDRLQLQAPLPGLRVGAVIEERVVVRDHAPFFEAGTTDFDFLASVGHLVHGQVVLDTPEGRPIHVRVHNAEPEVTTREDDGRRRQTYSVRHVPPLEYPEIGLPYDHTGYPQIDFATGESWQAVASSYGAIVDQRIEGADLDEILSTLDPNLGPHATINHLLAELQDRVRYTGLELGAASIVPARPADTLARQFGDCKDKSSLLVALLRESGIEAWVALLSAGFHTDVDPELPGLGGFNHAIVVIPEPEPGAETVWIDPTDPYARAGQIPIADQGRWALVARPETTELTHIPHNTAEQNTTRETRQIVLANFGPGRVVETTEYFGVSELAQRSFAVGSSEDHREIYLEYMQGAYLAETLEVAEVSAPRDLSHPFSLRLESNDAAAASADLDEAAVGIGLSGLMGEVPDALIGGSDDEPREAPYQVIQPHRTEWHYQITPPPGFALRELPESEIEELGSARLSREFEVDEGGRVLAELVFELPGGVLEPEDFEATRQALGELQTRDTLLITFDHEATVHMAAGRSREAIDVLRALTTAHPEDSIHAVRLARGLLMVGLGDEARRQAAHAIQLDEEEAMAYWMEGFAWSHDALGRLRRTGFDLERARQALERAAELDPENALVRAELAILLDHDAEGRQYGPGADLDRAIEEYRSWREDFESDALLQNLMATLGRAERWQELHALTDALPASDPELHAWRLTALAMLEGPERALREASRLGGDRDRQATLLGTAAQRLLMSREYPAAAALLRQTASISPNPAAAIQFAEMLGKVQRLEDIALPSQAPETAFKKLLLKFADPGDDLAATIRELTHPDFRDLGSEDSDEEIAELYSHARRQLEGSTEGASVKVALELALAVFDVDRSGDDATGYRLELAADLPNQTSAEMVVFVRPHEGTYHLVGSLEDTTPLAMEALQRLADGDLDGARQWLDWAREGIPKVEVGDPLGGHPFSHLWQVDSQLGADQAELAAAALLAVGNYAVEPSIQILENAIATLDEGSEPWLAAHSALLRALATAERWQDLGALAEGLEEAVPDSEMPFFSQLEVLEQLGPGPRSQLDAMRKLAETRLERLPEDPATLRLLANFALDARQDDVAAGYFATLRDLGGDALDAVSLNQWSWAMLFHQPLPDDTLDLAQEAAQGSQYADDGILHTLATAYAADGRPLEAHRVLLQAIELRPEGEIERQDWVTLGWIAEAYGMPESARRYYQMLEPEEDSGPLDSWSLAQHRLAVLEGSEDGSGADS